MAVLTTTSTGLTPQYQTYFDKKMLQHAVQKTVLNTFGQKRNIPRNKGATTVRFFRRNVADPTAVNVLTEGVAPTARRELVLTPIDVTLVQYGEVGAMTDILQATDLFDTLDNLSGLMGEDAALQSDGITRNEIVNNVTTDAVNRRYSQQIPNYATLQAASNSAGRHVVNDLLDAVTLLKINRAPMIDGGYVEVAPPAVTRDLMDDDKWVRAAQYSNVKALYNGEVGTIYGVRVIEATNPFRENGGTSTAQGTYDGTGNIFTSIVMGQEGYGVVDMAGMSVGNPRIIVAKGADKSDPLDQLTTVGWKAYWAPKMLNPNWVVTIRSKSAFV